MGFFGKLKSDIAGGLDTLSAVFSHPKTTFTGIAKLALPSTRQAGAEQVMGAIKKTKKEGAGKTIVRTITHTAIAAGTLLGAGTAAGRAAVGKILIPTTAKGAIRTATVATVGAGILTTSAKARKIASDPAKIPELAFGGGEIVGTVIEGKEAPGFKEALAKGGLIGGAAVLGVGAVVVGKKLLDKIPKGFDLGEKEKVLGDETEKIILPETQKITPTKKPSKRRRAKKTPSVRQSVRINILNKPVSTGVKISNKRYIKNELLTC